jgi:hypothetical protein
MKTKIIYFIALIFCPLLMISQQKFFMQVEVSRSFTTYGDMYGNKLGAMIGISLKNYNLDIGYSRSMYEFDDSAYFKSNTLFVDKDYANFPIQRSDLEGLHKLYNNQNKGYYSKFSNLNTTEINMIELGISKNFGEKKFFFCPRFGIGNAVVDIKTLIEDTTSEINYSLEKKYRYQSLLMGYFKFYDINVNLSLRFGYKLTEHLSGLISFRTDYLTFSKNQLLEAGITLRSSF